MTNAFVQNVLGLDHQPPEVKRKLRAKTEPREDRVKVRNYALERYRNKLLLLPYEFNPLLVAERLVVKLPDAHYQVKKMVYYGLIK